MLWQTLKLSLFCEDTVKELQKYFGVQIGYKANLFAVKKYKTNSNYIFNVKPGNCLIFNIVVHKNKNTSVWTLGN